MYYSQLRAFHAVAVYGGFTKAAQNLGLTQPTISDQVSKLERDFDVVLFNRVRKRTNLTETGQKLFKITDTLLDMETRAVDLLTETRALKNGKLVIAADAPFHILRIVGAFRRLYPEIALSVNIGNSKSVMERLLAYQADIGVLANIPDDTRFESVILRDDPLVAVVQADHPWSKHKSIKFEMLFNQNLVLREHGSITRRLIEEEFAKRGVIAPGIIEMEGRESVREAVAAGAGVGFVSEPEFGFDTRLSMIRLENCDLRMRESMVCLKARYPTRIVTAFWEVAGF